MHILLFGASGQIGNEVARCAVPAGVYITAVDRTMCDLSITGAAERVIAAVNCDSVINAAAYTAVDKAETEKDLANAVNAAAPGEIAQACALRGLPLVHLSTDYVFNGQAKRSYVESDTPAPLGVYGATKLAGEDAVAAAGGAYAIMRTSWVFSAHGSNFVKTMLRVATERDSVRVVADQRGKPTPASAAAIAALSLARALAADPTKSGVYHFAGDEETTWADFAVEIFRMAVQKTTVEKITTVEYPTPAKRPFNSSLDTTRIRETFGIEAPSWRDGLRDVLNALGARNEAETE